MRIGSLDGLRAFAILFVLLAHSSWKLTEPLSFDMYGLGFQNIIHNGWSGVDLFFVLSGFLITAQLLRHPINNRTLHRYICKRYFRIAPAYYASVFLTLLFLHIFQQINEHSFSSLITTWWAPLLSHILFFHDYIAREPSIDGVFWSIPVEVKFYMLIPIFIYALSKIKSNALQIVCILSFYLFYTLIKTLYLHATYGDGDILYSDYFFYIRAPFHLTLDGLIIGSLCAFLFRTNYIQGIEQNTKLPNFIFFAGLFLFVALTIPPYFVNYTATVFERTFMSPLMAISFGLILCGSLMGCAANRFLSSALLHFIAKISYSIYLTHIYALFLQIAIIKYLNVHIESITYCWLLSLPIYLGNAVCLAYLLHVYVEKPCTDWSRKKWSENKDM